MSDKTLIRTVPVCMQMWSDQSEQWTPFWNNTSTKFVRWHTSYILSRNFGRHFSAYMCAEFQRTCTLSFSIHVRWVSADMYAEKSPLKLSVKYHFAVFSKIALIWAYNMPTTHTYWPMSAIIRGSIDYFSGFCLILDTKNIIWNVFI